MNTDTSLPTWLLHYPFENECLTPEISLPAWLKEIRQYYWQALSANGLPTSRDERFKYTNFSFLMNKSFIKTGKINVDDLREVIHQHRLRQGESILLVFVNGCFMPMLSDLAKLPQEVIACPLSDALQQHAEWVKAYWPMTINVKTHPFASLNAALSTDGLFFYLPDQCQLTIPIHLLFITSGQDEFFAQPHAMLILGQQSQLTLLEEHFSLTHHTYLLNQMTTMNVGREAQVTHYKIQQEGQHGIHIANTFIHQQQESHVSHTNFSVGGLFARDDMVANLKESGARCTASGFYHLHRDGQYVDHHVDINHIAPHSHSEMLYKGIINHKSRAVFNGRLYVEKNAQHILAHQANHHLLLSANAEAYSKPELEIYADDVKCKHGATTGQIDTDALYYLRSRGINQDEAMALLLAGFAEDILQRVTHPNIKVRIQEAML